jgi:DnaJ family protein C protein 7
MVQLAHIFKKDKDKEKEKEKEEKTKLKEKNKDKIRDDISISPPSSPRASYSATRKSPSKKSSSSPKKSPSKTSPTKTRFSHSHSSSTSTPTTSFKFRRSSRDQDLHPLNLPPDELHRRLSAMADQRSSMDIDTPDVQMKNGGSGNEERSPTPPPHKSTGTSDEAESFKLAGNKFFKDGNYKRAIEEYNKGMPFLRIHDHAITHAHLLSLYSPRD